MSQLNQNEPQRENNDRETKPELSEGAEDPQTSAVSHNNQDRFSINSQNVQPFSSLDENRMQNKNQDFEEEIPKHAHVGHIVKVSSSQDVLDAALQPNLHKTHSQSGQNNEEEEEQSVDVASCQANADESKRDFSIAQSEGFVTSNLNQKEVLETQATEKAQQLQNATYETSQKNYAKKEEQSNQILENEQNNQQNQQNQDEQQFGDFEEMAATNVQNQRLEQQNVVKIKQAYLNSQQGAFYKQKQMQLQTLVDKLDDYSILLQQAEYQS